MPPWALSICDTSVQTPALPSVRSLQNRISRSFARLWSFIQLESRTKIWFDVYINESFLPLNKLWLQTVTIFRLLFFIHENLKYIQRNVQIFHSFVVKYLPLFSLYCVINFHAVYAYFKINNKLTISWAMYDICRCLYATALCIFPMRLVGSFHPL